MAGIKIPVEAQVNTGDLQQATQQFVQQFNKLGEVIAQANKIKFDPISKATLDDLRKVERQFDSLRKISGAMNTRMKATGQAGAGFFDVDWGRMYSDSGARAREMRKAFEYVTGHAFGGTTLPSPGGAPRPAPSSPPPQRPPAPSPGVHWASAGRSVVSAGLRATGGAGAAADGALSAGMSGGIMAGLAGLVGGIVALGVGKAIGSVMGKVGDAQNELIQYDTLKRTLGDVNVGFETLKGSLRATADDLQIPINEAGRLGSEFAKIADLGPEAHKSLALEVGAAGGFGRSFGMDPATSNAFFAQMRLMRVTGGLEDSRRLSLMIGEAIAKSGSFAKADEVLQAIGNFAAQQTRLGLVAANVGGYAGMLSGLVKSGTPGMDPQGAAALLSRVNSSIAGGGAAGEASQYFLYSALGSRLGLNPIQTKILQEQGAFGSAASTFGQDSTYARYSAAFGGSTPAMSPMSQTMTLPLIMDHFRKVYAGKPDLMADAIANALGISISQAMELALAKPETLGDTEARLKRLNPKYDLTRMSHTGIAALTRIQSGGLGDLQAQASSLRARTGQDALTSDELKKLNDVMGGDNLEAMRDVLTELTVSREQERTEGEQTRDKLVRLDNTMQKAAAAMVPLLTDMRAGILFLAGGGKQGPMGIRMSVAEAESKERRQALDADYDQRVRAAGKAAQAAKLKQTDAWTAARDVMMNGTPEEKAAAQQKLRDLQAAADAAARRPQEVMDEWNAATKAEDARLKAEKEKIRTDTLQTTPGTSSSLLEALIQQESGGHHYGADGDLLTNASSGARGIAQILPGTGRSPGLGVTPLQNDTEAEHRRFARDYLGALMRRYGGDRKKALAAYNWGMGNVDNAISKHGDDWLSYAPKETQDYVPSVLARVSDGDVYNSAVPGGARGAGDSGKAQVAVNVNVNGRLQNEKGEDRGVIEASKVKTTVDIPAPYGAP